MYHTTIKRYIVRVCAIPLAPLFFYHRCGLSRIATPQPRAHLVFSQFFYLFSSHEKLTLLQPYAITNHALTYLLCAWHDGRLASVERVLRVRVVFLPVAAPPTPFAGSHNSNIGKEAVLRENASNRATMGAFLSP